MRALRLCIARPATSDSVIPTLLAAAGLVPEATPPPFSSAAPITGLPLSSSPVGASPLALTGGAQGEQVLVGVGIGSGTRGAADAAFWAQAQAQVKQQEAEDQHSGQPQSGQQQVVVCPPPMSKAQVLAVLPPKAAQSVWLAAFMSELKSQWGFPRAL